MKSQGRRNTSSKTAWESRTREQHRGSIAVRRIANKSSDREPQASTRAVATCGWRPTLPLQPDPDGWGDLPEQRTALVDTSYRGGGRDTRTTSEGDWPTSRGSRTLARPTGWRKTQPLRRRTLRPHKKLWPAPEMRAIPKHHLHCKKIDLEQLPLLRSHPGHETIEEVCAPSRPRRIRIQVQSRSRWLESKNPLEKTVPHHPRREIHLHRSGQWHR